MIYSQNDPRWKNILLGFNTSPVYSIGTAGCYVTAIANVCDWAGNSKTPQQINDVCKQNGWFVDGGEINRDDIPALLCSNLGFTGRTNWTEEVPMDFFNDASDPNVTYIIKIDASPAAGMQSHFVMVWNKPNESDLTIHDSWDGIQKLLSHYGNPTKIIYSAMRFVRVAAPTPAAAPAALPYTVEEINPKQVKTNKSPTTKWGMNYGTFTAMVANPITTVPVDTIMTVVALVHHNDGYQYYRTDLNDPDGWNILDCDDYTPPAAPPYTPPAAPIDVKAAETYKLNVTVMYFDTAEDAINRKKAVGTLGENLYFVIAKQDKAYNLSDDNTKDKSQWVNILDNVIAPNTTRLDPPAMTQPTAEVNLTPIADSVDQTTMNWRGSIDLRYAGMYVFYNHNKEHDPTATTVSIVNLDTGKPLEKNGAPLTPSNGQYAQFSGKVKWSDGNWYGRLKDEGTQFNWYAVRIEDLLPYKDMYGTRTSIQEREILHTLTALDRLNLGIAKIKTIGRDVWDIIAPKERK